MNTAKTNALALKVDSACGQLRVESENFSGNPPLGSSCIYLWTSPAQPYKVRYISFWSGFNLTGVYQTNQISLGCDAAIRSCREYYAAETPISEG